MQTITITTTCEITGDDVAIDGGTIENAQKITELLEDNEIAYKMRIEEEDGRHSTFGGRNVWANVAASGHVAC